MNVVAEGGGGEVGVGREKTKGRMATRPELSGETG